MEKSHQLFKLRRGIDSKTAYEVQKSKARALNKMLRVARTFADFDYALKIREKDIRLVMKARDSEGS